MAEKYAQQLLATEEYDACYQVANYYYLPLRDFTGFYDAIQTRTASGAFNPRRLEQCLPSLPEYL